MSDSYSLISVIGTGQYTPAPDGGGKYRETVYEFPNGWRSEPSRLFLFEVMRSGLWNINKVVLIGTTTSSWDALVPDKLEANGDLWSSLYEECSDGKEEERPGLSELNKERLEEALGAEYGIPFVILTHNPTIDSETIEDVVMVYDHIYEKLSLQSKVLLDVTHGFRIMPMLMYQALQLYSDRLGTEDVSIIYGEYKSEEQISYVRDISKLWYFSEVNRQVYAFKNNYSGLELAKTLKTKAPELSDWIERFSRMINRNHIMQIGKMVELLQPILKKHSKGNLEPWIEDVYAELQKLYDRLGPCNSLSETMLEFSVLLFEHNLTTQAIIALRDSVQIRVAEKMSPDGKYIGDHGIWESNGAGSSFLDDVFRANLNKHKEAYRALRDKRNQIAHAGGEMWSQQPSNDEVNFNGFVSAVRGIFAFKELK